MQRRLHILIIIALAIILNHSNSVRLYIHNKILKYYIRWAVSSCKINKNKTTQQIIKQ